MVNYKQNTWLMEFLESLNPGQIPTELYEALNTMYYGNFIHVVLTHLFVLGSSIGMAMNFDHYLKLLQVLIQYAMESEKTKYLMIASMSHEFRNPLNSMLVSVEVLKASLVGLINPK